MTENLMRWNDVDGSSDPLPTHVVMHRPWATIDDWRVAQKVGIVSRREEWEPTTVDVMPEDMPDLYRAARRTILKANKTFGFNLTGWQQPLRFNVYGEGHEFRLHMDYTDNDHSKLAFVHIIQAPKAGGTLGLWSGNPFLEVDVPEDHTVVFPAFLMHQVSKITQGQRIALVGWATGPDFV